MKVLVVDHPLAAERLTRLRSQNTSPIAFRRVLKELSEFLIYEATRDVHTEGVTVQTPLQMTEGIGIAQPPLIVPVLRAALGMLEAALKLLPTSEVGFLGVRRNEDTLQPEEYLQTVPADLNGTGVLVLDPMLATGGSLVHACEIVKRCGAGSITAVCAIAAPEGVERLRGSGLVDMLAVASIDDGLNDDAFIVPGLGDAGDRQFGVA